METKIIFRTVFTLFVWALWPFLSRKAGLPLAWILLFLGIGFLVAAALVFAFSPKQDLSYQTSALPVGFALALVALAAFLNVSGMITFAQISDPSNVSAIICMAVVMAGVPAVNRLAAPLFERLETLTWINMVGIIGTVVSILLVVYKKP